MQGSFNQDLRSDRLQRAIEKNRAKQARRALASSPPPPPPSSMRRGQVTPGRRTSVGMTRTPGSLKRGSGVNLRERLEARKEGARGISRPVRKTVPPPASRFSGVKKTNTTSRVIGGHTVAREKKSSASYEKFVNYLVNCCWLFLLFLLGRLIFADRGVIDYYSRKNILNDRVYQREEIKKENIKIAQEIDLIKNNKTYQKKLIRDNLGFISQNEYMVLFSKKRFPASSVVNN